MGAEQSKDSQLDGFFRKWILIQKTLDPHYGEIEVYRNDSAQTACLVSRIMDHKALKSYEEIQHEHPNIIQLLHTKKVESSNLCNNQNKIFLLYEYLSHDLSKQIQFRYKQQSRFSEEQIWYLLKATLSGLQYLKKKHLYYEQLTTDNILLTQQGIVKLFDPILLNSSSSQTSFSVKLMENAYLSPEQMKRIAMGKINYLYDKEKCSIFQLGMCILEAIYLNKITEVCNQSTLQVQFNELNLILHNTHRIHKYSLALQKCLSMMLHEQPVKRPRFQDIIDFIQSGAVKVSSSISQYEKRWLSSKVSSPKAGSPAVSPDDVRSDRGQYSKNFYLNSKPQNVQTPKYFDQPSQRSIFSDKNTSYSERVGSPNLFTKPSIVRQPVVSWKRVNASENQGGPQMDSKIIKMEAQSNILMKSNKNNEKIYIPKIKDISDRKIQYDPPNDRRKFIEEARESLDTNRKRFLSNNEPNILTHELSTRIDSQNNEKQQISSKIERSRSNAESKYTKI